MNSSYIILITTPTKFLKPYTWWKGFKRWYWKKEYDTICFSVEVDKEITIFETTIFGWQKATPLKDWKKSKLPSVIIPIKEYKKHL